MGEAGLGSNDDGQPAYEREGRVHRLEANDDVMQCSEKGRGG